MKILIVDDELVSRMKMKKLMEAHGECQAFEDGASAVEAFENALETGAPFDLATLDIGMPDMDGTQVLHRLREIEKERRRPNHKKIKVIMVTAHSDKKNIITSIQAGCDDYVVKPFTAADLLEKLKALGLAKTV